MKYATAQQKVSGSANPVAVACVAQTQNMKVSGNGVLATSLLSEAWASESEKGTVVCLAVEVENA